jgi:hypothetical protein
MSKKGARWPSNLIGTAQRTRLKKELDALEPDCASYDEKPCPVAAGTT